MRQSALDLPGQEARGEVLVYDRGRAAELAFLVLDHRHPAAAHGHHHEIPRQQVLDGVELQDFLGDGRGHDAAPAPAGVLDHVPLVLFPVLFGLLLGHEGADGLVGLLESRVVLVDQDLRDHGHRGLGKPSFWNSLRRARWM